MLNAAFRMLSFLPHYSLIWLKKKVENSEIVHWVELSSSIPHHAWKKPEEKKYRVAAAKTQKVCIFLIVHVIKIYHRLG